MERTTSSFDNVSSHGDHILASGCGRPSGAEALPSSWTLFWRILQREMGDTSGVALMFAVYTMLGLLIGAIIGFSVIALPQPGAPF